MSNYARVSPPVDENHQPRQGDQPKRGSQQKRQILREGVEQEEDCQSQKNYSHKDGSPAADPPMGIKPNLFIAQDEKDGWQQTEAREEAQGGDERRTFHAPA